MSDWPVVDVGLTVIQRMTARKGVVSLQRWVGWFLGVWVCVAPLVGHAETVANLYQQSELVIGQGADERRQATEEALASVLVRVTGQPQALNSPVVKSALSNPEGYMEAFRYESGNETLEQDGKEVPATTVVLNFSRVSVEKLLRTAGLPLWPDNRPSVLVWLVKDDLQTGREMVSLQDSTELSEVVKDEAEERGLPVVTPLMDLEDQVSLNANDLWNLDQSAITEASSRYKPDAILVGRYSQTSSGRWISAWTLLHKQSRQVFDIEGQADAELLQSAINSTSDYLADIYGISNRGVTSDAVVMDIQQVGAFADYVKVLSYLEGLAVVRELSLMAVEGTQVKVTLSMDGDISQLKGALDLDHRLAPVMPATSAGTVNMPQTLAPQGSEQNPLRYRWSG